MARRSSFYRIEESLSPAILIGLLGGLAAHSLLDPRPGRVLAAGLLVGTVSFVVLWLWRGRRGRRRVRGLRRWWRAERGGALIALLAFLGVTAGARAWAGADPSTSVSWGLWVALPLWLLWFTASFWWPLLARLGMWVRDGLQQTRKAREARPKRSTPRRATLTRSSLSQLSPDEFELLCGQIGEWWGFRSRVMGQAGDGGVDVEFWKGQEYVIAQCKHYLDRPVGPGHIRDFYGALIHSGAQRGFFFTSGYFTGGAEAFARGKPIALIDKEYIENAIERYT